MIREDLVLLLITLTELMSSVVQVHCKSLLLSLRDFINANANILFLIISPFLQELILSQAKIHNHKNGKFKKKKDKFLASSNASVKISFPSVFIHILYSLKLD